MSVHRETHSRRTRPGSSRHPTSPSAASAGWHLERGALVVPEGVRFSVWCPLAERPAVRIVDGPAAGVHPLAAVGGGVFEVTVEGVGPGTDYLIRLDDGTECPDPVSRWQPAGVHGPSRVVDPDAFEWTDAGWRGLEMPDYAIYELHVGTFTPEGTFDAVRERLAYLRDLGVTAIELLPVAEFPGGRNWGYDGVGLYAPQSTYGGPDGLRRLVDAAHGAGLAVVLDVVYNHLGPEGNYLGRFGPYFTERYRTPWGPALNYDGPDSDEVRRFVIENARHWIAEYHVDALRLDAVHGIFDFGALHLLQELGQAVREEAARRGRRAVVIAESDLNDPRVIRPAARGGYEMDAQWSDDFHHAVHSALTGERDGYYEDFGGVAPVAKALRDRFVYDGRHSPHRRRRHGAPATDVPADRFVISIQNHDQVGNRARGDRLGTLLPPESQRLAAALLLLSPYVPLLFMGEEYGETNPFLYFVSHQDPELLAAVREGRRREFEAFAWSGEVPDPGAGETFARSRLAWERLREPRHAGMLELYRDLLRLRRTEPALRPGAVEYRVRHDPGAEWVTVEYGEHGGTALVAAFNLGAGAAETPLPGGARWRVALSTDDPRYGGPGGGARAGDGVLALAPRVAALCRADAP